MSDIHVDRDKVRSEITKRQDYWSSVYRHFLLWVAVNVVLWAVWIALPKDPSWPPIPVIVTGAWAVMLFVHAMIVFMAHKPYEVGRDEIDKQVQHDQNNYR
jgi:hypothetical protein